MKTTKTMALATSAVLLLLLAACGEGGGEAVGTGNAAAAPAVDPAFAAGVAQWRRERHERLVADDGWTSLVGLHWLELKAHYVGSDATSGIRIAKGPPKLGLVQQENGRLYFTPQQGVMVTLDGEPVKGRVELRDDHDEAPTTLGFDDGKGAMTVIARGQRRALRVRHAEAATRAGFAGIEYWPVDPGWRVAGRFVAHPAGKTIEIANIIGTLDQEPNPGAVEFERDGRTYRLEALDDGGGEGGLFLILADRTSGHGSYGAGRYLYADAPAPDGSVVLDFNRATNPPCAFTAFATCPLPPPENRLDLAVTAGEKAYVHVKQ